jgi:hypothetical protein
MKVKITKIQFTNLFIHYAQINIVTGALMLIHLVTFEWSFSCSTSNLMITKPKFFLKIVEMNFNENLFEFNMLFN